MRRKPVDPHLPDEFSRDHGNTARATNSNEFHGIGMTTAVVLGILSGLAFGSAAFSMWQLTQTERETRMLEYYLLELDAKVIAAGIKKPEDAISKKLDQSKE